MSPIRASEREKYPADWSAISQRIRERAGHRCEQCGVENYAVGARDEAGAFLPAGFVGANYREAAQRAYDLNFDPVEGRHWIVVVLTVAHLNHDPADCRDENLQALCQRCHNRHDVATRRAGIVERRRALNGNLFA